jgi:hypothetical protein
MVKPLLGRLRYSRRAKTKGAICVSMLRIGLKNRVAMILQAIIALVTVTGAGPSSPTTPLAKPAVLQIVGSGQNVWMVAQKGSQVALWSTESASAPWQRLGWPKGVHPVQLVREHRDAWAVSIENQVYATMNAGMTWKAVSLPRLLTAHPHWAQGLRVAPMGSHGLALLAWGGEAAFQSAKLLWISGNHGQSWTRVGHSVAGPVGATASWWPKTPKTGLPTTGDPVAVHMLGARTGYLIATTPGGPFLWRTTNGGTTWDPVQVLGMSQQQEDQGIMVSAAQWSDGTGWVTLSSSAGPGLIRLTRQSARMVALPPRLVGGIHASLVSAASGSVIGKVPPHWSVFTTTDGGADWQSLSLAGSILPQDEPITQTFRTPQALWIVLSGRLYAGTLTNRTTWHRVALP